MPGACCGEAAFWAAHSDVRCADTVLLADAFLRALPEAQTSSPELIQAWTHIFLFDIIESRLLLPFAKMEVELEGLLLQVRGAESSTFEGFRACLAPLMLSEKVLRELYGLLGT